MKIIGKISMFFATLIIVAHTIVPHQHKAQLEVILHECFFSDSKDNTVNIFDKLEDIIKHVNLGEKHLENFRVSSYEYEFPSIAIFEILEISSIFHLQLKKEEVLLHNYYYNLSYSLTENELSSGLRAPPSI